MVKAVAVDGERCSETLQGMLGLSLRKFGWLVYAACGDGGHGPKVDA